MRNFTIYTDGGCEHNPGGAGGIGAIIIDEVSGDITEISNGYKSTTNNRMEIIAAIEAIEITPTGSFIALYSDSQYLIQTMHGFYSKTKNHDLWTRIDELISERTVTWHWVKGHADNRFNNLCDKLATRGMHKPTKEDIGYKNPKPKEITNTNAMTYDIKIAKNSVINFTGIKRKINIECREAILNLPSNPSFKDYASLKTYGNDEWSSLKEDEIENNFKKSSINAIRKNLPILKDQLMAYRWFGRGLDLEKAIRKVLVDKEIQERVERIKNEL